MKEQPGFSASATLNALLDSNIKFVTTRHEQGAAFMADVHGRLTGQAGVCLATLGPGATNLITGVADANMDLAPIIAIAGQGSTTRLHKESHQILDLVSMFDPISKYSTQIREAEIIPEVVRKAFKVAEAEKPGCSFIDFPENIAGAVIEDKIPLKVQSPIPPSPPEASINEASGGDGMNRALHLWRMCTDVLPVRQEFAWQHSGLAQPTSLPVLLMPIWTSHPLLP